MNITEDWVESVTLGGEILGGGGGGSVKLGRQLGQLAVKLGNPTVLSIDEFDDEEFIITVSAVGAPSAINTGSIQPMDFARAVWGLVKQTDKTISGLMTNEMGGLASANGLIQSAVLDIPIIDAAGDGRAHPTAPMGAIGLSTKKDFVSYQYAVGRDEEGNLVKTFAQGKQTTASAISRATAERAGFIAVTRDPVEVNYVKKNAAIGALTQAQQLGEVVNDIESSEERVQKIIDQLGGELIIKGEVSSVELKERGGFDVGMVKIGEHQLTFWNEYMTLEVGSTRLATFPDLILTLSEQTGRPVSSADIKEGIAVSLVVVPKENLTLGSGMQDPSLFKVAEQAVGKEIIRYSFPDAK